MKIPRKSGNSRVQILPGTGRGTSRRLVEGSATARTDSIEAEAGMAEMSEKFREKGGEIYLPAAE
jgi:phosphomethylpyrimidine synthase